MNKIILHIFTVGFCFGIGHALECYKCEISVFNLCLYTKTTCSEAQQCYSGSGKAVGLVDVKVKGCLDINECNKTSSINFPQSSNTSIYSVFKACCITNLCNSAPALPRIGPFPLAIATLALLVTKALV